MKKRGMIELQFHWIFVLIAGAVIFIFFINIISKQREYSEIKTSGIITTNLESILTGAQISTSTVNIVGIPKADIGFECNRYFIGPVPKQTKGNVIFAPGLLKGKQLITWALDWSLPYRVTNFLYLTDPQLRYVIVYNATSETLANKLLDELPKEMNIELIAEDEFGGFVDKNNYKVKFIFLVGEDDSVLAELTSMPDEDVTAIRLTDNLDLGLISNTGTIKFLKNDGGTWTQDGSDTFYLKKESLFGAIFAEDLEMYNCVMRKAFKKLNLVSQVYYDRSYKLATEDYASHTCNGPHSAVLSYLEDIKTKSAEMSNSFPTDLGAMGEMKNWAYKPDYSIEHENERTQLFSCVLIY